MPVLARERHRSTDGGLRLRLKVMRNRLVLDSALAHGADPTGQPSLVLRARQLTEPSMRRAMAGILENLVEAAGEPPMVWGPGTARPPLQRDGLFAARRELLALADRLRKDPAPSPQCAALAALLIWDSASPAYAPSAQSTVAAVAVSALGCS